MIRLLLALCLGLTLPCASAAAKSDDELVEIEGGKPITLRPDRAYLLFRTESGVSPVFLRVPTDAETQAYEAARREAYAKAEPGLSRKHDDAIARRAKNVPPKPTLADFDFVWTEVQNAQTVKLGRALEKNGAERTLLLEAVPGDYVLYGLGFGEVLQTCLCLGTISFKAEPGKLTDLGTLLVAAAASRSDVPELAGETGFGPSMNGHLVTWAAAIRPAGPGAHVPASLAGQSITPAVYRATGKFVASFAFEINRLAPIPGVLGYDRGDVLDATGRVVPNQY